MKAYIGAKIIQARSMDEAKFMELYRDGKKLPEGANRAGYLVKYPDGYISWSPKLTFETAYRLITDEEKALI